VGDKVDFFTMPWEITECVIEHEATWWDDPWGEGIVGWYYSVKFESGFSYSPVWENQLKPIVD
jgi:hypothetical protein